MEDPLWYGRSDTGAHRANSPSTRRGALLSITDLSGGERATAILIARLLVTASTTRVPTVWFDEPLEHLDPRRRSAVARTIVRAGQTDTVAQLIVSTYEDRIARQLAAADPDNVRVVHADVRPHYLNQEISGAGGCISRRGLRQGGEGHRRSAVPGDSA